MLKVVDRFTTRDGSWEPSSKRFSITPQQAAKYGSIATGAAHHIFVYVPPGAGVVEFETNDPVSPQHVKYTPDAQWSVDHALYGSSAYNPDNNEVGPWVVRVDGEKVAEGIGLPFGWHVSTFLIVEEVSAVTPPPPTPPGNKSSIKLYLDGELVFER